MHLDVFSLAKKTGSLLLSITVTATLYSADIDVSAQSVHGVPLTSVAVGKPFSFVITLKNPGSLHGAPHIDGLSSFHVAGQASRTSQTHSGTSHDSELTIIYTLVADKPGTYTIGPVRFDQLPSQQSAKVTVEVIEAAPDQKKGGATEPKLTLQLDKVEVYRGEKVPFVLRFTWQEPELKPIHIEMPQLPDVQIQQMSKGTAKTERKGNQVYNVLEFTGFLYPEKAGIVRIPQLRAQYTVPREEHRWSNFFPFQMQERESTFSQAARLTVLDLPRYDKPVAGVGTIKRFSALLQTQEIPRGEAGTLILSAQGDADFSKLTVPALQLPESFRSYRSKTTVDASGIGVQWSFVIQGLEEGRYTIPEQELTYFDSQAKSYKTLRTKPLSVTITPGAPIKTVTPVVEEKALENLEQVAIHSESSSSQPIASIPLIWFVLLMMLPPLFSLGKVLGRFVGPMVRNFFGTRTSKKALQKAIKRLNELEKRGEAHMIYEHVKSSLANFLKVADPTDEEITISLQALGYSKDTCHTLERFLHDALHESPYAKKKQTKNHDLFKRARSILQTIDRRACALIAACLGMQSLEALSVSSFQVAAASSLEVVPFISLQLGVLIGWWLLWIGARRFSSELRYLVIVIWLAFLVAWAICLPNNLYQTVYIQQESALYVGPSYEYPSRATLASGDVLALVKKDGAWYYVSSLYGKGWIPAASIEKKAAC